MEWIGGPKPSRPNAGTPARPRGRGEALAYPPFNFEILKSTILIKIYIVQSNPSQTYQSLPLTFVICFLFCNKKKETEAETEFNTNIRGESNPDHKATLGWRAGHSVTPTSSTLAPTFSHLQLLLEFR